MRGEGGVRNRFLGRLRGLNFGKTQGAIGAGPRLSCPPFSGLPEIGILELASQLKLTCVAGHPVITALSEFTGFPLSRGREQSMWSALHLRCHERLLTARAAATCVAACCGVRRARRSCVRRCAICAR